jgi:hypothetical protein
VSCSLDDAAKMEQPVRLELTSSTYGIPFRKRGRYGCILVSATRIELALTVRETVFLPLKDADVIGSARGN